MLRYCGPFLFLGSVPALFYIAGHTWPLATIGLLLAALIVAESIAPRGSGASGLEWLHPRLLPLLYIPLQLIVVLWATWVAADRQLPLLDLVSLMLSVGVTNGVFGVLAAHEMVHSRRPFLRVMGALLLTGMTYRQFRIAHIVGHHRWAATSKDSATARAGEGFYAFLLRTLGGQLLEAWRFEERRRRSRGRPILANRIVHDAFIMAALYCAILALLAWRGVLFFAGESAVGIIVLELFNYIAHYGLVRAPREPMSDLHSWNSSNVLANALIFNMGRHSAHHRVSASPFPKLYHVPGAPELPAGYAGSILLALVPPLWRRVMDPEIARLQPSKAGRVSA